MRTERACWARAISGERVRACSKLPAEAAKLSGVLSPTITRTLSSDGVLAIRAAKARARRASMTGSPPRASSPETSSCRAGKLLTVAPPQLGSRFATSVPPTRGDTVAVSGTHPPPTMIVRV